VKKVCVQAAVFLVLLITSASALAQSAEIDSLLQAAANSETDTARARLLNRVAFRMQYNNPSEGLKIAHEALAIGLKNEVPRLVGNSYMNIGHLQSAVGLYDTAIHYYDLAEKMYTSIDFEEGIADTYTNKGIVFTWMRKYPLALEFHLKALRIFEKLGLERKNVGVQENIGMIHYHQNEWEKALQYFTTTLNYMEETGDSLSYAGSLMNIGRLYFNLGVPDTAVRYMEQAASVFENSGDLQSAAMVYNNVGAVFGSTGELEKALPYMESSLRIRVAMGDKKGVSNVYNNLAGLMQAEHRYEEAITYSDTAHAIAVEIGALEDQVNILQAYFTTYQLMGKHDSALSYLEQYATLNDSILSQESRNQVAELSAKYDSDKKEREIELLEKNKELLAIDELDRAAQQQEEDAIALAETAQKSVLYGVIAFGLFAALIIGIVLVRKRKSKALLVTQKQEIESKGVALHNAHLASKEQREEMQTQHEARGEANVAISHQKNELEKKNSEIMSSIRYAERIQASILPSHRAVRRHLTASFILFKPKDIVSGDFYWIEPIGDKILFAAVDCTGHGIPGAFVSMVGNTGLDRAVREFGLHQPAAIMDKLAEFIDDIFVQKQQEAEDGLDIKDGMDMTLCSLDRKTNVLEFAGAKNPLYVIRRSSDPIPDKEPKKSNETHNLYEYKVDKQPIGAYDNRVPYTNQTLQLKTGDALYLFSDGFADQFGGPKGKKLKYRPFQQMLLDFQGQSMQEQKAVLDEAFVHWAGDLEQVDDVIIFGVRI
jgi:serine phosphatase RsbU (regulator of sigma subunit)